MPGIATKFVEEYRGWDISRVINGTEYFARRKHVFRHKENKYKPHRFYTRTLGEAESEINRLEAKNWGWKESPNINYYY